MTKEPTPEAAPEHEYNRIFETLVGPEGATPHIQGLVAYGLYKVSKREWISDFTTRNRRRPSSDELDAYTRTWTPSQISTVQDRAAQVLAEYALTVLQDEEPRILARALRGSFWRAVPSSMLAAFL